MKVDALNQIGGTGEWAFEDAQTINSLKAVSYKSLPIVCYAAGFVGKQGSKAHGIGWQEEVAPTLREGMLPNVCIRNLPH